MTAAAPRVLTIGHSDHTPERFVELLRMHDVTAVADVRSAPYSRLHPAFNREPLARLLEEQGIAYVFLGRELGGRSSDPACYVYGRVQYRRLAETELFRAGIDRVLTGAETHRIALLCAEKEPLACHRSLLVARELEARGAPVAHIHADGQLEAHTAALDRLLELLKMPTLDLFLSREELIEQAYARQEERVAYVDPSLRAAADEAVE